MADGRVSSPTDRALHAWEQLRASPGEPQWLDVPILVELVNADQRSSEAVSKITGLPDRHKILLTATTESGEPLGHCAVYTNEWYPDCPATNPFSHYFQVLWYVLDARLRRGITDPLRLQVLKAVAAPTRSGRQQIVLLKFIVAPEYTVTGSFVEQLYNCPLQVFFERFLGLSRDSRGWVAQTSDIRGRAIHAGYRRALVCFHATKDREEARRAYRAGVWEEWTRTAQALLATSETGKGQPSRDLRDALAAADSILSEIERLPSVGDQSAVELYLERLFYSATRGLSGRADRVEVPLQSADLPIRIAEVKTRAINQERDPLTGVAFPGGLQALAYRELLQSVGFAAIEAVVELLEGDRIRPLPLEQHPLVQRLGLDLSRREERVIDLIAQARNVFYCVASGLFTGYDRYRLDQATRDWRLSAVIGQYDLLGDRPPCRICVARLRRICPVSRAAQRRPLHGLFRSAPAPLFSYWVWFHRQLKAEEHAEWERLFHLVHTPAEKLEAEGITLGDLLLTDQKGCLVTLRRQGRRLDTRMREDDIVLVTPQWPDGIRHRTPRPGELFSVEARVVEIGEEDLVLELREQVPLSPPGQDPLYRVDQLTGFALRAWQLEGLADFLIVSMEAARARGRQLDWRELPPLTQTILGLRPPVLPERDTRSAGAPRWLTQGLNEAQHRALEAVLALRPGELLLVQGPPGTGKTRLIAAMIRALVAEELLDPVYPPQRRPVLVLTNTHRAANEVVQKVVELAPDVLPFLIRVGSEREDMEEDVARRTLLRRIGVSTSQRWTLPGTDGELTEKILAASQRARVIHDHAAVFVGTLGSADAAELRGLTFGTVIVDEAAQATEPAFLQALRRLPFGYRGRVIVVGDENQLPPVVSAVGDPPYWNDLEYLGIRKGDTLRTSAFERLHRRYPQACIRLTEQYRMNGPICDLVSHAFYEGLLRPGDERVANRRLVHWLKELGVELPDAECEVALTEAVLAGLLWRLPPILYLDTSNDPRGRDSGAVLMADDEGRINEREAGLIARLLGNFLKHVPEGKLSLVAAQIGVISPYRRQNTLLRQRLLEAYPRLKEVRVDTVDRFQGGEREIIVVSLVNSNTEHVIGPLHREWRRLNVALSRARSLLVLVGDRETFTGSKPGDGEAEARERFRRVFERIDELARRGDALVCSTDRL